ncbi:hypothetical protein, variant 2 [Phytophthora nicotianae P10297]|uniref:Uncharacterized protein n=2 Tax=Phytophthora nicotianae TaxID=4792 RepID=W2ZKH9_PHYNI|nr:hypothetical protein F442_06277 [Phytophthora nicotianae P10297]ETP47873.1 hypothetical protein, variant 1 [Phytophthora nicotianae P10297]ETP47874.1 hypothetical protein, variant 2 [Phytophthora nicotianae P10297]
MQVGGRLQHPHGKFRAGGRRAYMNWESGELSSKEEKQTQTELGLVSAGKTRFVTPRLVLGNDENTDMPFARAFADLCQLIRSPALQESLLIVFGHDTETHQYELERKIREDEASESIDDQLRVFFDTVLASLIQERETTFVNTIHECVQQEMQTQQVVIQNQQQRITQLTHQIMEWEKQVAHLKGKVDRRVAENNALRKEQYRQLLMLRDIMSKQGTEPGALSALNEAIGTVLVGKQTPASDTAQTNELDQSRNSGRGWLANANTQVLHREKEKWEQRAREAALECQQLRDRVASLTQENTRYRANESTPWFLKPENAIAERRRIADAVRSYQGNWEEIGDSLVELLNNDILWAAVEKSARRGNRRSARGLEAMLTNLDSNTQTASIEQENNLEKDEDPGVHQLGRRQSSELGRLIPCRACSGVGYIHTDRDDGANDADSYLRKTLEQVLELKTQLEKANTTTLALEGQLQLSTMHAAELQEKIQQAELIKSSAVDSCLQTDLDEEEGIDVDEIMSSAYGQGNPTIRPGIASRQHRRNVQYDNLIVELKSTLAVKDEGLTESRKALEVAQERMVTVQRALQKEKDAHAQELAMLKTSLAFSLKTGNTKIEERQAAVKLLMKKFAVKSPVKEVNLLPPMDESKHEEDDNEDDIGDNSKVESTTSEQVTDQNEVKRMEALVERYAKDIIRVKKEHETQQELLKKAEAEIAEEDEKRSRTNSISQGSLVVSMASHPRDLFKALSTAQADIMKQRRASQRSSALQTDRLLTLTTHLGHMSEELCTLRKRNLAEVEFWKLECEKLQNTNKALEAEQQIYQKQLQEAHNQAESVEFNTAGGCSICEKHKKRLMLISNELLNQAQLIQTDPEVEVPAPSTLTEAERKHVSNALLDLENIYAGMTGTKQQLARELVAAHLGNVLSPRSRRTTIANAKSESKDAKPSNQTIVKEGGSPLSTRSTQGSPRKNFTSTKGSKSSRQLKTTEAVENKPKVNPPQQIQKSTTETNTDVAVSNDTCGNETTLESALQRKKLVHEVFEGGDTLPTKRGLAQTPEMPEIDCVVEENVESGADNNAGTSTHSADLRTTNCTSFEDQDVSASDDEAISALSVEESSLLNSDADIERDPEVIQQLRVLINQSSVAKGQYAVRNWQVLVFRVICLSSEKRLDQIKRRADRRSKIQPDGTFRLTNYKINTMCDAMTRIVQQRKGALDGAISTQSIARNDLKKAQAHLLHGVSMLLDNLSGKGKSRIELNEFLYPIQGGSPRRSPTSNRPLYPYAKVHMNHIPQTQQIPTSTFPALASPSLDQERSNRSDYTGGKSPQNSRGEEGYQLPQRLTKSAGPRPFNLVHSSICALRGSMPFPDSAHTWSSKESEGSATSVTNFVQQRPVRPHSSPAGPRFMSPRSQELMSSASSLHTTEKIVEA